MSDQYYIKVGRRYRPVEPYHGFPADGVWVVKDMAHSSRLIMRLDGTPEEAPKLAKKAQNKSYIANIIVDTLINSKAKSTIDVADEIAEAILDKVI